MADNGPNDARMNRAFSAGSFISTRSWGAAPGCYDAAPLALNTYVANRESARKETRGESGGMHLPFATCCPISMLNVGR